MNRDNLLALAILLERKVDPARFNMRQYVNTATGCASGVDYNWCGTVACAAGHGPMIFPALKDEQWEDYVVRVFGFTEDDEEWDWCFSSMWTSVDNTPSGAAKRIRWMLNNGVPDNHREQMFGDERPCYA